MAGKMRARLGGQEFEVDSPQQAMQILQTVQQLRQKFQERQEHERVRNMLSQYNLDTPEQRETQPLEESYRGAVSRTPEGELPDPSRPPEILRAQPRQPSPQVRNLRELVDVISGMKGLPAEYAGALISKLTGIPDPSMLQAERLKKIQVELERPQKEAQLEERKLTRERLTAEGKARIAGAEESRDIRREGLLTTYVRQVQVLGEQIKNSIDPAVRAVLQPLYQRALEDLANAQSGGARQPAAAATPPPLTGRAATGRATVGGRAGIRFTKIGD